MRTFAPHLKITEVSNRCFSGCSAVGSVPGLGPGCRRFESCHPDESPSVCKLVDFLFYLIPASQKKNAIHISELRYIYILKFPVGIMLYAVRNYAGVFLISK